MAGFSKFNLLLITGIIGYLTYTLTYICPINDVNSFQASSTTTRLTPLLHHTCEFSHQYLKPVFHSTILPNYQQYIEPSLHQLDESFNVQQNFDKVKVSVEELSTKLELQEKFQVVADKSQVVISAVDSYVSTVIYPQLILTLEVSSQHLKLYYQLLSVQVHNLISVIHVYIVDSGVLEYVDNGLTQLKSIKFIADLTQSYNNFVQTLINTKSSFKFHEKSEFIKQEFKNLVKFNETRNKIKSSTKFKQTKKNIVELVKDILSKVSKEKKLPIDKDVPEEKKEVIVDDVVEEVSDYSDEEPETVLLTSTVTVTNEESSTGEPSVNKEIEHINQELERWEAKVNKTLQLATHNLEVETEPFVNETIETIKVLITDVFTQLHKDSHSNYKLLHQKIININRDYEHIKSTHDTDFQTVTRQEIRDDIKKGHEIFEEGMAEIQKILIDNHELVIIEYYKVIQDTIDILESFSESTFKEFSNNLSTLIESLEESDSDVTWKFWKKFHKIKEEVFEFRDLIYDGAEQFNYNNGNVTTEFDDVIGLKVWNEFVKNIEFHMNYVNRDNDDYLKVIRAQANVAFQAREEIVRELLAAKAAAEKPIERIEESHEHVEAVPEEKVPVEKSEESASEVPVQDAEPVVEEEIKDDEEKVNEEVVEEAVPEEEAQEKEVEEEVPEAVEEKEEEVPVETEQKEEEVVVEAEEKEEEVPEAAEEEVEEEVPEEVEEKKSEDVKEEEAEEIPAEKVEEETEQPIEVPEEDIPEQPQPEGEGSSEETDGESVFESENSD